MRRREGAKVSEAPATPSETTKPLFGECSSCFASGGLYYPNRGRYLCPEHARLEALWGESREHLIDLLIPVVEAWKAHWRERGLDDAELVNRVQCFEEDLLEAVREYEKDD